MHRLGFWFAIHSYCTSKRCLKEQMKKNQTNNDSKEETIMNPPIKFELQPLPYSYK